MPKLDTILYYFVCLGCIFMFIILFLLALYSPDLPLTIAFLGLLLAVGALLMHIVSRKADSKTREKDLKAIKDELDSINNYLRQNLSNRSK